MAQGQAAGLRPSTFVEGGGLLGDVDVTFQSTRFCMWDYNGKQPTEVPAIHPVFLVEDTGEVHESEYLSCGQGWVASEDGKRLIATGSSSGLNANSNGGLFIASIVNAGFPEDKIGDDISVFDGMKAHVIRQVTKREGLQKAPRADGRSFEPTVLVVSKIHKLPWEGQATGAQGGASTGSQGSGGGSLEEYVQGVILEVLGKEGKGIPKAQLVTKVFQEVKNHPKRNDIVQMVHRDSFLGSGPWKLEGGVVSMG